MKKAEKSSLAVVILHWGLVLCIIISFFSGQRIASDHLSADSWWAAILPVGAVFDWHRASAYVLLVLLLAYLLFIGLSGRYRYLLLSSVQNSKERLNRIVIWVGLLLLCGQAFTGLMMAAEGALSATLIAQLHRCLSWCWLVYFIVHLAVIALAKGWRWWFSMCHGAIKSMGLAALLILIAGWLVNYFEHALIKTLTVTVSGQPPTVDGLMNEPLWRQTESVTVFTRHGNNDQAIPVEVRAVTDRERIYFSMRWPDSEASLKHLPLIKRDAGWAVDAEGFSYDDERSHYEDKLALMLANDDPLAALRSIHLGSQPLASEPVSRHRRGYHYTTNGQYLDVWHWKAVRTDHLFQADDNHFGPANNALACAPRYTAGYAADPSSGGGYLMNYNYFAATVTPLRLPYSVEAADARGWMRWSDGNAYQQRLDARLPVLTTIPGIVDRGPFQGDRGDIGARGFWQNGYWQLEMSRRLMVDSPFDTEVRTGTLVWVAIFDHAQTRHSYHLWPLKLQWQ